MKQSVSFSAELSSSVLKPGTLSDHDWFYQVMKLRGATCIFSIFHAFFPLFLRPSNDSNCISLQP